MPSNDVVVLGACAASGAHAQRLGDLSGALVERLNRNSRGSDRGRQHAVVPVLVDVEVENLPAVGGRKDRAEGAPACAPDRGRRSAAGRNRTGLACAHATRRKGGQKDQRRPLLLPGIRACQSPRGRMRKVASVTVGQSHEKRLKRRCLATR